MNFYNSSSTSTFVFLYHPDILDDPAIAAAIPGVLVSSGFSMVDSTPISVATSAGQHPIETVALFNGGKAFIECKCVNEAGYQAVELQVGGPTFSADSMFSRRHYGASQCDRLRNCIERLCCIRGFRLGFGIVLSDDESEVSYRKLFATAIQDGEFSLARLLENRELTALFVGALCIKRHGKGVFLNCPTWKRTTPASDALCLFFVEGLYGGSFENRAPEAFGRQADDYLRRALAAPPS